MKDIYDGSYLIVSGSDGCRHLSFTDRDGIVRCLECLMMAVPLELVAAVEVDP